MDKIDLGGNLPFGFCGACLRRMAQGALYGAIKVAPERIIMHAYCEHNQAGASVILRPEGAPRWSIQSPIDVLEWRQCVAARAEALELLLKDQTPAAPGVGLPAAALVQ